MDKIYQPKVFDCTEPINLKDHFQKFSSELYPLQLNIPTLERTGKKISTEAKNALTKKALEERIQVFMSDLNLDSEQRHALSAVCSPDNLTIDEEIQQMNMKDIVGSVGITKSFKPYEYTPESLTFETVKRFKDKPVVKRDFEQVNKKYFELDVNVRSANNDLKAGEDFAVYVRFYAPFAYTYATSDSNKKLCFDHEIILLGSNTLADLKDKIFCFANNAVITDVSNDLSTRDVLQAQDLYPSSFIFIDNVFYNDLRQPNSKDNSEVIRNWAKEKSICDFDTKLMNETRIDSLKPRFGYPYVYQHQGRCEHIFIFSQARLLNTQDCLTSPEYPYFSSFCRSNSTSCYICGHSTAVWIVLDCERLPLNKTPLCTDCLKSYCYLGDEKIGNFTCYAYSNRKDLS